MSTYAVSQHAVDRYRSRVEDLTEREVQHAIEDLLKDARLRPTPRHWMRQRTSYGSGIRFGYSPRAPHVALVLRESTVVTVLTRSLCRRPPTVTEKRECWPDRKQRRKPPVRRDRRRTP